MTHYKQLFSILLIIFCTGFTHSAAQEIKDPSAPYSEPTLPQSVASSAWSSYKSGLNSSWGSTDIRYPQTLPPKDTQAKTLTLTAWQGERVNAQFVLWALKEMKNVTYTVSDLKTTKQTIRRKRRKITIPVSYISAATQITSGYVRYVWTDELNKDKKGGCGDRSDKTAWDSSLVADVIDPIQTIDIDKQTTRPGWITIQVPPTANPGTYSGTITIKAEGEKEQKLNLQLVVKDHLLPEPSEWSFHLDLWQNPYAITRVYGVEPWSEEHFKAMRPYMTQLARAGQKVITTSITYMPWNGQTEDPFNTMVTWMKKADGTWYYDFTVFDKWVEFMMSCGIDKQINCYSMIPWRLSFQYYDQATNSMKMMSLTPGRSEYNTFWGSMLQEFAAHLKAKGWFDITTIGVDERPMEQMREVILLVKEVAPDLKVSLAGNYHPEIEKDIYDYCITSGEKFPEEVKQRRDSEKKISTYYTCCAEAYPNTFTFSAPAEAAFIGWFALKGKFDGYLRWAYNSWTAEPLKDTRFRQWAAGDTYLVYPGYRSSIRFERLIEGIQAYEKYRVLKTEAEDKRDKYALKRLEEILNYIQWDLLPGEADEMVNKATKEMNKL